MKFKLTHQFWNGNILWTVSAYSERKNRTKTAKNCEKQNKKIIKATKIPFDSIYMNKKQKNIQKSHCFW